MHVLGKLVTAVLVLTGAYEAKKWWDARNATLAMVQGHTYALGFNYTKDPISPVSQQQVQQQLDAKHPGLFNVLGANMTPGPQSGIRQMAVSVELVGNSQDVPASYFTDDWPVSFGTVTLASHQDMGAATGVS